MNVNLYSIYDTVAQVFNKPFTEVNDNSARRVFVQAINKEAPFSKTDYTLFCIGSYTDHDGVITPSVNGPVKIMTGFDIPQAPEPDVPPSVLRHQSA